MENTPSAPKRYAALGAWFGLLFPIFATLLESYAKGTTLLEAQRTQPLLWIIDSAPLFLGIAASMIGKWKTQTEEAMEEMRRSNQKLEAANEELVASRLLKNQFLANISHELRTPLNAIIGFARLTLRKTRKLIPERQAENMQRIQDAGTSLLHLVNDILDIERLEAGAMKIIENDVSIEHVFAEVEAIIAPMAEEKNLNLSFEVVPELTYVWTDAARLRQIVINLAANAVKYSDTGSIKVRAFTKGMHFVISVEDDGIGISEEQLPTVFEPFRQVDGSSTRAQNGVGLGLNLVRQLTKLLGGSVDARSQEGQGSTFRVVLPLRETSSRESAAMLIDDKPASIKRNNALIFVVDDDEGALKKAEEELLKAGYEVRCFSNSKLALREAETLGPDVFLVDMVMAGWNGWSTLRAMENHDSLSDIPVVVVSFLEPPDKKQAGNMVAWVSKPIEEETLLPALPSFKTRFEVLIVEDDESTRELIIQHLAPYRTRIRTAANGAIALEILEKVDIDFLILDLMMPEVDGYEVLRSIQNHSHVPETIVFSAASEQPRTNFAKFIGKGDENALEYLTSFVEASISEQKKTEAST